MDIKLFDYHLPVEYVAQKPLAKRDNAKFMVVSDSGIKHDKFYNVIDYLKKDDVLVVNETKVRKAKLIGKKETGAYIETILVKEIEKGLWETRIRGHRLKEGNKIIFPKGLQAVVEKVDIDVFYMRFNKIDVLGFFDKYGELPLPFYVKKKLKEQGMYQTEYANSSKDGSLAAPTAGLHFTKELLAKIKKKGVKIAKVCLDIDFGTFLPIKEKEIENHKMHEERYEIDEENARLINERKGRLIVVGTTSFRVIESAFDDKTCSIKACKGKTSLYVYPGYKFKNKIDAMITNFHLPKSSLLILVCGFFGREKMLSAYSEAVKKKYRFYSFGDAMMLVKE